jgi:hypothetical protein
VKTARLGCHHKETQFPRGVEVAVDHRLEVAVFQATTLSIPTRPRNPIPEPSTSRYANKAFEGKPKLLSSRYTDVACWRPEWLMMD